MDFRLWQSENSLSFFMASKASEILNLQEKRQAVRTKSKKHLRSPDTLPPESMVQPIETLQEFDSVGRLRADSIPTAAPTRRLSKLVSLPVARSREGTPNRE